jgi:alpha-mannosidase
MGDLYNFCPVPGALTWRTERAAVRVLADGPVVSELEVRVQAERPAGLDAEFRPLRETLALSVSTVVRLVRGSPRVEFRTTIDNATRDHRLRVVFPVGAAPGPVRAEGHFAVVRRPIVPVPPQTEWAEPPDATQHTLGAVAIGPIALVTKGLPEYEARRGGDGAELCLTLLRCVGVISQRAGVLATRPHSAGPQLSTPEGQCLGRHELEYALVPQADTLDDLALLREAQDYRSGLLVVPAPVELDPPLALEGDVAFSCLKGAEDGDGLILRCFNPSASPTVARVVGDLAVSQTRLDETGERSIPDGVVQLGPNQIATLRLR